MADQTERIIIEIDGSSVKADAQQVERAINTIGDAADKAGKKVTTAEKGISELGGALKTTGSSAKVTEREFNALQTSIGKTRPTLAQADALKQVANSAKQSASEMANLGRTAGGGVGQIRGITSAATPAATAMSSLSGAAGLLVRTLPLVGGAVAAINLTGLISQSTQLAARYETLGVVMNVVGKNAGYTSTEMERFDKSLQKTGISMAESRNNLAKMASANIDLANASKLARIAQDAAVIGNMNSSQAFQSLIYGIQSAQVEVLRTIGINVNFEQSYKKLADQLGKTSNELTETEKTQARLNAVMEKAPSIAGAYEASLDTVGKKLGSAERLAENAKTMLGALFLPTWTAAVDAYSDALVRVNEELEDIDVGKAELLGRAFARIFTAPDASSTTLTGFAFNLWQNYEDAAEAANVTVKKSFFDTWAEIEKAGMNQSNRFIEVQAGLAAEVERANAETLESFRRASQTQRQKLDDDYARFIKAADGNAQKIAEINAWYESEVGKLAERETKKRSTELKKQVSEAKKAREEMLKGGKTAEDAVADYWDQYEKRRIAVIADSTAQTVKLRVDAEKEAADAATAILEKQQADAQKVMDNIQDATADVFYDLFANIGDGWETLWDSMKSWALRTLAELAARAATVQIVVPIMTHLTGTQDASGAIQSLTGGQGGLGSMPTNGLSSLIPDSWKAGVSGITNYTLPGTVGMAGAYTGAYSAVGAAPSMYATGLGYGSGVVANGALSGTSFAAGTAPMASGGMTLGTAAGYGGWGGLAYSTLGSWAGLPQDQYSGITSTLGGMAGAWGGAALAGSLAGAGGAAAGAGAAAAGAGAASGVAAGATMGSVLPVVGTIAGAVLGGLAGSLFTGDEHTPSIIFNAQTTEWGSTDSTRRADDGGNQREGFEFHTKSGAKMEHGEPIATALEAVATNAFTTIEATLASFGDGYVDMLDGAVVEFGRKTKGVAGGSWDFGSEKDMDKLLEEYAGKLQDAILQAAAGAFTAAGQDIASGDDAMGALGMLAEANAAQFRSLQDALAAGVQSGNVEAYIAQLQSFQATVQAITATWDAVNAAADDLVKPPTAYESAVRQANTSFDELVGTLSALGFASAQIEEIEDKRAATLARLNAEMGPLAEAEAARAAALADATSAVETAQGNLRAAYQREAAEIEATAKKWDTFAESLKKWRDDIMTGSMSPIPASSQAEMAASRYQDVLSRAKLGDEEAIAELQGVAGQQLDVAKDTAKTAEDYARSALRTLDEVRSVESVATRHADIARQQLEALTSQVSALITINESVLSVVDAIGALNVAKATQSTAQAAVSSGGSGGFNADAYLANKTASLNTPGAKQPDFYTPSSGTWSVFDTMSAIAMAGMTLEEHYLKYGIKEGIRGYASGGMHSGGLRLVGERGPELEVTGPARIWNAEDTKRLLSGGGDGTAEEVRALRDDLRAIGRALAKNTADTAKLMQRWDGDGMPEVRVA